MKFEIGDKVISNGIFKGTIIDIKDINNIKNTRLYLIDMKYYQIYCNEYKEYKISPDKEENRNIKIKILGL